MKAKILFPLSFMVWSVFFTVITAVAQQPPAGHVRSAANYTYHVFQAPNKMFGYDIMKNGKLVFHQFASLAEPANAHETFIRNQHTTAGSSMGIALAKKEHAEKAATLAIEKIKRKEPPVLSAEELKKIVTP
jgi:hypothetical protein